MSATGSASPKLTVEQFNSRKKRREAIHPIVVDDDCAKAYELAEANLKRVKIFGNDEDVTKAEKTLAAAEKELRAATVIFRLRALPREGDGSFAVLKAEHPPTDDDHEQARDTTGDPKAKARWRSRTFQPALVAASLVEPAVSVEQAAAWAREWNDGEWIGLVAAALDVNTAPSTTGSLVFS